jgi:hypothetical protein
VPRLTVPAVHAGATYRETVEMGILENGPSALSRALDTLKAEFGPDDYNILTR